MHNIRDNNIIYLRLKLNSCVFWVYILHIYIYMCTCVYICNIYYVLVSRNGRVKSHNKLRVNKQPRLFNLAFLTVINVGWVVGGGGWHVYMCSVSGSGAVVGKRVVRQKMDEPHGRFYNVHYLHDRPYTSPM